jgi:23S rRNA pseudouridine1911/1915/1917 synthase
VVAPERFVLAPGQARDRVDRVLAKLLTPLSRATIQRWIHEGRVTIDGTVCRPKDNVAEGMVVEVDPGPEPSSDAEPDPGVPFDVLFEDPHLIVVVKPAGVVVHPARGHRQGTLVSGLLARPGFERADIDERDPDGKLRPGIVHRIDKDTSGILVVAKDAVTREGLKAQFAHHSVMRVYHALTIGVPRPGRIDSWHGRDPRSRLRFTSRLDRGRRAVTNVRVLETFAAGAAALVECRLETGRTHQIRVHLSEQAGTPLLADALYGGRVQAGPLRDIASSLGRQALHARALGFEHPIRGERLSFEVDLPSDMAAALSALRALRG